MKNNVFFEALKKYLKGQVFKLALKKILGSAAMGGFKAWIIRFILENLWDEIVEPLMNAALVEIKYIKDKVDGKITAKKIEQARLSGDQDSYDSAVDELYER